MAEESVGPFATNQVTASRSQPIPVAARSAIAAKGDIFVPAPRKPVTAQRSTPVPAPIQLWPWREDYGMPVKESTNSTASQPLGECV